MKAQLKNLLSAAIAEAIGEEQSKVSPLIEQPKNRDHGDLCFPCFTLAKREKLPPPQCAAQLAAKLQLPSQFDAVTVIGPFLNVRFARGGFTGAVVNSFLVGDTIDLAVKSGRRERVVIDYSSPNIAKPFHVGHLRATLIGNALDRIYRRLGCTVTSVNHLGDWGTQFGFVFAGCQLWGKPEQPTVKALVQIYRRATGLKEQQEKGTVPPEDAALPSVNDIARQYFLDLEAGKPAAVAFWQWNLDVSLVYLRKTYDRLGVNFDHYLGESFYSDKLDSVRNELEQAGLLTESQGAWGVDLGEKLGFARILAPDGRSLYLTRDLATAKYRAETFHYDRSLYVVGAPQTFHFQQLKGTLERLGRPYAAGIEHVAFGHVLGMKTRGEGEVIELNDFLDEAYERALTAYHDQVSKRPEGLDESSVADAVALAAIVFSTLSRGRLKDVHFSWDNALAFQGDSGPYLLYANARIHGIRERAFEQGIEHAAMVAPEQLTEESAFQLASVLAELPDVLERTVADNEPSYLASYGLSVAHEFSRAYNELKVIGEPDAARAAARMSLFEATRRVLSTVIELLGMKPIDRM